MFFRWVQMLALSAILGRWVSLKNSKIELRLKKNERATVWFSSVRSAMSELLQWFKLNWTVNVSDRIEIGPDRELDWSKGVVIGKMFLIGRNAKQIVTALRKVFGQRPSPKTSKSWESTARPISTAQIQISAFSRAKAQLPKLKSKHFPRKLHWADCERQFFQWVQSFGLISDFDPVNFSASSNRILTGRRWFLKSGKKDSWMALMF